MHSSEIAAVKRIGALPGKLSLHPLFRDFGLTAITEFGVLVAGLAIVSLMGRLLGIVALGEYLLLRRVLAWLQPAVQLGMGNALPRYVAYNADGPPRELRRYLAVSLVVSGGLAALLASLLYLGRGLFARWLFGSTQMQTLILPLGLMTLGLTIHGSAYGYFRGRLALIQANALQAINVVFVPLIAVIALARTHSVALIVGLTGMLTILFSILACASLLRLGADVSQFGLRGTARKLLEYGVPRVPGDFALGALLAVGPLVAMHFVPISGVTCLLLGISILSAVNASSAPVGTLMLSKVSMMLVQDRQEEVQRHLRHLLAGVVDLSTFACLQLLVFTDVLLRLWVGPHFGGGTAVARIVILAIPFYLVYGCLRGSIDAASITAYNTRNLFFALCLFGVLLGTVVAIVPRTLVLEGVAASLLTAFVFLGWLTLHTTGTLFGVAIRWREFGPGLAVGLGLTCVSLLVRLVTAKGHGALGLFVAAACEPALFVLMLKKIGSPWLSSFLELAFRKDRARCHDSPTGTAPQPAALAVAEGRD